MARWPGHPTLDLSPVTPVPHVRLRRPPHLQLAGGRVRLPKASWALTASAFCPSVPQPGTAEPRTRLLGTVFGALPLGLSQASALLLFQLQVQRCPRASSWTRVSGWRRVLALG